MRITIHHLCSLRTHNLQHFLDKMKLTKFFFMQWLLPMKKIGNGKQIILYAVLSFYNSFFHNWKFVSTHHHYQNVSFNLDDFFFIQRVFLVNSFTFKNRVILGQSRNERNLLRNQPLKIAQNWTIRMSIQFDSTWHF